MIEHYHEPHSETTHTIESHRILPSQFYPAPSYRQPSWVLLSALVDDAIYTIMSAARHPSSFRLRRLAHEDSLWFLSDSHSPFSFRWCADMLDLDVDRVRAALHPYFVHDRAPQSRGGDGRKTYPGYRRIDNVTVTSDNNKYLAFRHGQRRTHVALASIHPDTTVHYPGDRGTLICTLQAARKAGLLRPRKRESEKLRVES
jgi:hypothetical protein